MDSNPPEPTSTPDTSPEQAPSGESETHQEPTTSQGPVVGSGITTSKSASFLKSKSVLGVFVALFAGIATYLLIHSYAATTTMTKTWQTTADWTTNSKLDNTTVANNVVTLTGTTTSTSTPTATTSTTNLALNHRVIASSTESRALSASFAVDGKATTRWSSNLSRNGTGHDPEWLYVDLGSIHTIGEVKLQWEAAYGKAYPIQTSNDTKNWTSIYTTTSGDGGTDDLTGLTGSGRYVRMHGTVRGTKYGYSLWEFQVFGSTTTTTTTTTTATTYPSSGSIALTFDAYANATTPGTVDWTAATPSATTPTGTSVAYQYSTSSDNTTWSTPSNDITTLADSRYLKVVATLATTVNTTTPTFKSLIVTYNVTTSDPVPAPPTGSTSDCRPSTTNCIVHWTTRCPAFPSFPNASCTGVPAGTTLTAYNGCVNDGGDMVTFITADNTVISGKTVNCGIVVQAHNVQIINSVVNGPINTLEGTSNSFAVINSQVNVTGGDDPLSSTNITVLGANLNGGQTSMYCYANCYMEDSWVHGQGTGLADDQPWHLGGVLANDNGNDPGGYTNLTLIHNNIICDYPVNKADGGCSGDVNLFGDFGTITHVLIDHNLLGASTSLAYCTYGGDSTSKGYPHADHVVYTNNIFGRGSNNSCGAYGPATGFNSAGVGNVWTNNVWDNGGAVIPEN
jgi:hypothetical protein